MTRETRLTTNLARANPEIVLSERCLDPMGLWFQEKEILLTIELAGFVHVPTLLALSEALTDEEYELFVMAIGHAIDVAWDVTVGVPEFWIPPDWEAVRLQVGMENLDHEGILTKVWS